MTDAQREAAIERMYGPLPTDGVTRRDVAAALDALLSGFVVLHRDDVERRNEYRVEEGTHRATHRRAVWKGPWTRWEPITKEGGGHA